MTGMDDLVTWLRTQLDDDERVAKEASRDDRYPGMSGGRTETGEHWRWYDTDTDAEIQINPVTDEFVNDGTRTALRSVEEYPTNMTYTLSHFVISNAEEVPALCGMHIARWDPARVLAEVDVKRRILDEHGRTDPCDAHDAAFRTIACDTVRLLALPYADRPGYRDDWRP